MRFGAPVFDDCSTPELWVQAVQKQGYRAALCPASLQTPDDEVRLWGKAAAQADIAIAEVGAWSNPLSPDEQERRRAVEKCTQSLDLAERLGARCCVNIAGSRSTQWDGPHPNNMSEETFDMIVESVRGIIDAVQPKRAFYVLETMPWIFPDSPDNYLRLLQAIDRPMLGVHLDPANMMNSPQRFFRNADFIRECFAKLGPYVKSCHGKDIALGTHLTVHLDEVRPGLGGLDYRVFLAELNKVDPDVTLLLEHLPNENEYSLAAQYVRSVAQEIGIAL